MFDLAEFLHYADRVRERTRRVAACIPSEHIEWTYKPGAFTLGDLVRHIASPNALSGPKRHTTVRPLTRHTDANWPTAATRYSRCSTDCTRSRSRSSAP